MIARLKGWPLTLLKIGISLTILGLLVYIIQKNNFWAALQAVSVWDLLLLIGFYLFLQFLSTVKWWQLAHAMGLGGNIFQFYQFYLMGMFYGQFLPTAIGGDVGRAMLLAHEKSSRWLQSFLSILAERFTGVIGLLLYAIISLALVRPGAWWAQSFITLSSLALVAATVAYGFPWLERHQWSQRLIHRFVLKGDVDSETAAKTWPTPLAISRGVLLSICFHGFSILAQMFIVRHLGGQISFSLMAIVYALTGLASMIPLSFGGLGLREGAATLLLHTWANVPLPIATAFSLVWGAAVVLSAIPGSLLALRHHALTPSRKNV